MAERSFLDQLLAGGYGLGKAAFGWPGVGHVEQALDPQPQVTNRMSMFPMGNYSDGSVGPAWPQGLVDAKEAFGRFGRGEPPQPQDAVLAGLAMTGAGAFGLGSRAAARSSSSVAGAERAGASGGLPSHIGEAGSGPVSFVSDGAGGVKQVATPKSGGGFYPADVPEIPPVRSQSGPVSARIYRGHGTTDTNHPDMFWGTSDPKVASDWAVGPNRNVTPGDVDFKNALLVDASGGDWNHIGFEGGFHTTDDLARIARERGNDGIRISNVYDGEKLADTYAALQRGTVKSPLTGETLFSNAPDAAPVGALPAIANASEPVTARVYRGAMQEEKWPPVDGRNDTFWSSSNPSVADLYSGSGSIGNPTGWATQDLASDIIPSVTPANVSFRNPLEINKGGTPIPFNDIPFEGKNLWSEELAQLARQRGHDGLVLHNVQDGGWPPPTGTTYAALQPGTVKSATTGETLFSNPPSPTGLLPMAGGGGETQRPDFIEQLLRKFGYLPQ